MEGIESTEPFFKNPHLMDSEEEGQVSVSPSSDKTGTITSSEMEVEDGQQGDQHSTVFLGQSID